MKKLMLFILIAVFALGTVSAQTRQRDSNSITVNGILKLERGHVAVQSGDSVYSVPVLTRYIGFIDELKEGKAVSVEGYVFGNIIYPAKLTIDDKSYDFSASGPGLAMHNFQGLNRNNFVPNNNLRQNRNNTPNQNNWQGHGNFNRNHGRMGHNYNNAPNRNNWPGRGNIVPNRNSAPNRR